MPKKTIRTKKIAAAALDTSSAPSSASTRASSRTAPRTGLAIVAAASGAPAPTPVASPAAPSSPTTPTPTAPAPTTATYFVAPPPAGMVIPPVPPGAVKATPGTFRAVLPKKSESAALPGAVADLQNFTTFSELFGCLGVSYADVLQVFIVSNQWTTARLAFRQWDTYASGQEGLCWQALRPLMARLLPAFNLAVAADPSLLVKYPNLATVLGAKKAIAKKGVSTRKANDAAAAAGKPATHGAVGKQRAKAANKAILAAAGAKGAEAATSASYPANTASTTAAVPTALAVAAPPPAPTTH